MIKLNRSQEAVIALLGREGPLTRRQLCSSTGLSWAVIAKTVSQLGSAGFLKDGETLPTRRRGRNPGEVVFSDKYVMAGISVGKDAVSYFLLELNFTLVLSGEERLAPGDDPVPVINRCLEKMFSKFGKRIISVGISFPGIISSDCGTIIKSVDFPECDGRNIRNEIKTALRFDIPIIIERNAVCSLNYLKLADKVTEDTLLVSACYGVSAALMIDGEIIHGRRGNIGEIGHLEVSSLQVDVNSTIPCECGKTDCVETMVGGKSWQRRWEEMRGRKSMLPPDIYEAVKKAEPSALELVGSSMDFIYPYLSFLVRFFRPEKMFFVLNLPESSSLVINTCLIRLFEKNGVTEIPEMKFIFRNDGVAGRGAALLGFEFLSGNPYYRKLSKEL